MRKCTICGSTSLKEEGLITKDLGLVNKPHQYYRCGECKNIIQVEQLTEQQLSELYNNEYFGLSDTSELPSNYKDLVEARSYKNRNTIEFFQSKECHSILDVGAATGDFVQMAKEMGLDSMGIEFSEQAVEKGLRKHPGIKLRNIGVEEVEGKFDVVHLNHVFEHVSDPIKTIELLSEKINNGGYLYLEVPFEYNWLERIRKSIFRDFKSYNLHSVHHTFMYRPSFFYSEYFNQFELIYLTIFDRKRYLIESNGHWLKSYIWLALSFFGVGNYIQVVFRKI